jgi:hypothetical protein
MLIKSSAQSLVRGFAFLCATLLSATAFAGIPEPGLVLRGKVFNSSAVQQFTGTLQLTFTPQGSGEAVVVTTLLRNLPGDDGPYSYQVIVPLETRVSGFPENNDSFVLNLTRNFRPATSKLGHSIAAFEREASDAT